MKISGTLTAVSLLACGCLATKSVAADFSAGGYHVVRVQDGTVKGLGDGTYGQLGTAPTGAPATVAGLSGITAVAAGGFSTLALKNDGTVWFLGEITLQHTTPHGTPDPVATPVQVPGLSGIDAIAAGHRHFLALDADTGNLYAWGHNGSGQVGNGGLLDVTTPAVVLTGVSAMDAGDGFSLAVKSDQTLWTWGRNTHGQLGLGDTADRFTPTQVPGIATAGAVAAGGQHALVLLTGQTVLATGNNSFGQLGLGSTTPVSTFTPIPGLTGVTALSAGYFHSAALAGGEAKVWGRNFEGQCGGGSGSAVSYPSPQVLAALPETPTSIACGYQFTLLGLADGSISGTGSNSDGQLDGGPVADQDDSRKVLVPQTLPLVTETIPPEIHSLSPANGASGVAVATQFVLGFDETVRKGTGNIRIRENLANALVATIDVTSGQVAVNNSQATVALPAVLGYGTRYYIEVDAGAFLDLSGNPFSGMTGSKTWSFTTTATVPVASLIARYAFDTVNSGQTPDAVGSGRFATLGTRVQINNAVAGALGGGALEMLGSGDTQGPANGAVTNHNFSWAADARTVVFWWKAKTPNINAADGTFVSFGAEPANGTRFDIKEQGNTLLRVEVQGTGQNTSPASFDDGNWHFVALTVPDNATFADVAWYAGVRGGSLSADLNASTNTLAIATGTGPLAFGDSIISTVTSPTAGNDRVPNGYLDDFQLYDEVLDNGQIQFLYQNPGAVTGLPAEDFAAYIANPAFGLEPGERGFDQDPDVDGLSNGLEAWFGTHPGQFNPGLTGIASDGTTTSFTHLRNPTRPVDVTGFYEWSPNLGDWYACDGVDGPPSGPTVSLSAENTGSTTVVTATASPTPGRIFLRAGVIWIE